MVANRSLIEKRISAGSLRTLIRGNDGDDNPFLLRLLKTNYHFDYDAPPLTLAYQDYLKMVEAIRIFIYPDKLAEEGYEIMGKGVVTAHFQGSLGQINKVAANLLGPERGVNLFIKNMRAALPFGRHELEEMKKGYARYRLYGVSGPPALMRGIIRACLEAGGAKNIFLRSTELDLEDFIHEAFWS